MVQDAWMGDGRGALTADDIRRAVDLAWRMWWLLFLTLSAATLFALL